MQRRKDAELYKNFATLRLSVYFFSPSPSGSLTRARAGEGALLHHLLAIDDIEPGRELTEGGSRQTIAVDVVDAA